MKNIYEEKFLVDTNILVYYFDEGSLFHSKVNSFFQKCIEKKASFYIAQQNLLELLWVLVKKYNISKKAALNKIKRLTEEELIKVISPFSTTLNLFYEIFVNSPKNEVYDLFLAATALDNKVDAIVTNNEKDFVGIKNFNVYSLREIENA